MITLLGAGGAIANELAPILAADHRPFRLVGRNPRAIAGGTAVAADLTDREATIHAVAGSEVAVLLAGLRYDLATWRELWPRIMENAIEACRRADAGLVFFDNVYMYGRVNGPMTESTPYAPSSRKGEVRARIAERLMDEAAAGRIRAIIARSADFYGPRTKNGVPNVLVLEPLAKGGTASWMMNARVPHSLTFTTDAARAIPMLAAREAAWNQVWHLPTAPDPPTGEAFIRMAAAALGAKPRHRVLRRPLLRIAAIFDPRVRESMEMLYQNEFPYLFDSGKFAREFGWNGTPYEEGIRLAAESYREDRERRDT